MALFGLFVAQVTGSFVVAGAVLGAGRHSRLLDLLAIPAFILGAAVASALSAVLRHRGLRAFPILLGLESALLAGMLATALLAPDIETLDQPAALIVGLFGLSAMGVQNAFVGLHIKGAPSTNVMTTNTGNLAIDAAHVLAVAWLERFPSAAWSPPEAEQARLWLARTAPVVLAFLAGTVSGMSPVARSVSSVGAPPGAALDPSLVGRAPPLRRRVRRHGVHRRGPCARCAIALASADAQSSWGRE